jgi:DNA-binding LacI/PurR family transcriptional regulator
MEEIDMEGPTIHDVARIAGVSIASVSRVLKNQSPVSNETRGKVFRAIEEIGYSPKRNLPQSCSFPAVVISDPYNPCTMEITRGIGDTLMEKGYLPSNFFAAKESNYWEKLSNLVERTTCNGIIVIGGSDCLQDSDLMEFYDRTHKPIVTINRNFFCSEIPNIVINYSNAMYYGMRHLLSLNHRRFAFLSHVDKAYTTIERRRGIEKALSEIGLEVDNDLWVTCAPNIEGGYHAMNTVLKLPDGKRPTAVVAFNDLRAFGALHAIRSSGFKVPEDISVMGFDNIDMAVHTNPPLTTISTLKAQLGKMAADVFLDMLNGDIPSLKQYSVMESPLIVRESTSLCKNM